MISFLIFLTIVISLLASPSTSAQGMPPEVQQHLFSIQIEKTLRPPHQKKLSSHLLQLIESAQIKGISRATLEQPGTREHFTTQLLEADERGRLHLTLRISEINTELLSSLENREFELEATTEHLNVTQNHQMITGWAPFDRVEEIALIPEIFHIRPVDRALASVGSVTSAGDHIHRAGLARDTFAVDGSGQSVGVISIGTDHLADVQASGDLPASINVISSVFEGDEGTVLLEIVHDLAPGASLAFTDPGATQLGLANNINSLVTAGNTTVVDDIQFLGEPVYEDGIIAQTVDSVVTNDDVVYISAAGNFHKTHYEANYSDPNANDLHNFSGSDETINVKLEPSQFIIVVLQWNNRWGKSRDDYDLYLANIASADDISESNILAFSVGEQNGNDDPVEALIYQNPFSTTRTVHIFVNKFLGANRRFSLYVFGNGNATQHTGTGGAIYGHAAAARALAIGAINASDPGHDTIAPYSSRGPSRIYNYDSLGNPISHSDRKKPDYVAIDEVETRVAQLGFFPNPAEGTSISAPHAAAIAALVRQANSSLTSDQVASTLSTTARDLGATGHDKVFGFGLTDAFDAVTVATPTSPVGEAIGINHDWIPQFTTSTHSSGVAMLGPPTYNGADPGVVRLRNVAGNGFELHFQEWAYLDRLHATENIPFALFEPGRHTMPDSSIWEVGTFSLGGTAAWHEQNFTTPFIGKPKLFLNVQTFNGVQPVTIRARNVTATGFEAALFEEEALMDGHAIESIGYLAIFSPAGSGTVDIGGVPMSYALTNEQVTHNWTRVGNIALKLEEERSKDNETSHTNESIDVLFLGDQVFAQDVSSNGGDTAALRRYIQDTDGDGIVDIIDTDNDNDGMPDTWEQAHGLNPLDPSDAGNDPDGDSLTNLQEFQAGTDPNSHDSDGDGLPDGWEVDHGLNPVDTTDGAADPDEDGLNNLEEFQANADPNDTDSDDDGQLDGTDSRPNDSGYQGTEAGAANIGVSWSQINLPSLFDNPVVIIGPPTYNDNAPGVVRVRNVTADSFEAKFELRFQEWDYIDDGNHAPEDVPHLILEEGLHWLLDGTVLEVGTFNLGGTGNWATQDFNAPLAGRPHLFLTPQTSNGGQGVTVRARNVDRFGFEAALFEQESLMDGHAIEKVGYLAIYSPAGSGLMNIGGNFLPYLLQRQAVNERFVPVLSTMLKFEEEQSQDAETDHANETVDVLALSDMLFAQDVTSIGGDPGALRRLPPQADAPMEWGTLSGITHRWATVPLTKTYTDPIVVVKTAEQVAAHPGVIRIRNVTADSFEVQFQEWNYLDGSHTGERLFYLVVQNGVTTVAGLSVEAGRLDTNLLLGEGFEPMALIHTFAEAPALFTSVMTFNGGDTVTTRVQNLNAAGFDITMQEQENKNDGHVFETLGWIAIEKGIGTTSEGRKVEVSDIKATHNPSTVNFAESFAPRFPVVLANMTTSNGADPATIAQQGLTPSQVELFVREEQSADAEISHTTESITVFAAE